MIYQNLTSNTFLGGSQLNLLLPSSAIPELNPLDLLNSWEQ